MAETSDIRLACPQCDTRYRIPATKLTGGRKTLKCSNCGHSFPLRAPKRSPREPSGYVLRLGSESDLIPVNSLDTLKRWVIEGKVGPAHELSRPGEKKWQPLADIERFRPFFRVAEKKPDDSAETRADTSPASSDENGETSEPIEETPPTDNEADAPATAETSAEDEEVVGDETAKDGSGTLDDSTEGEEPPPVDDDGEEEPTSQPSEDQEEAAPDDDAETGTSDESTPEAGEPEPPAESSSSFAPIAVILLLAAAAAALGLFFFDVI